MAKKTVSNHETDRLVEKKTVPKERVSEYAPKLPRAGNISSHTVVQSGDSIGVLAEPLTAVQEMIFSPWKICCCDLSGEVYVLRKDGCEVCDGGSQPTPDLLDMVFKGYVGRIKEADYSANLYRLEAVDAAKRVRVYSWALGVLCALFGAALAWMWRAGCF